MDIALSRREREVAGLVAKGLTNREIAEQLVISERTAEGHVEQIRNKLGFRSRSQIAAWVVAERPSSDTASSGIHEATVRTAAIARPRQRPAVHLGRQARYVASSAIAVLLLVIAASLVWPRPHPAVLEVFAGIGSDGFSGDGGPATAAQLSVVTSMGFGSDGRLYLADSQVGSATNSRTRIRRIDRAGTISTFAGDPPQPQCFCTADSRLTAFIVSGGFVAVGPADQIYVSTGDPTGAFVGRFDQDGRFTWIAGGAVKSKPPEAAPRRAVLSGAVTVSIGPEGAAYVAEASSGRILRIPDAGEVSTVAGSGENGFSGDGGVSTSARLSFPRVARFSSDGSLHIADTSNNRVRAIDHGGTIHTIAGDGTQGFGGDGGPAVRAQLSQPGDVAFGTDGSLYIADTGNARVRLVAKNGTISTLVGPEQGLQVPSALAIDATGTLYIADSGTHRIYKLVR